MKTKGAKYNTHDKEIDGLFCLDDRAYRGKVDARFTSDETGETLSLTMGNLMFIVDYEELIDLIEEARSERAKS